MDPSDMPGVPRELAEQSLDVNKMTKPVKQKLRRFAKDRKEAIRVEILKLIAAGFIRECKNPVWLANPVLVPKKTGQWRMCIDYTVSTVTALKTPSLFRASTRSSTPPQEAPCCASSTATLAIIRFP
jgi:hypothetical protein